MSAIRRCTLPLITVNSWRVTRSAGQLHDVLHGRSFLPTSRYSSVDNPLAVLQYHRYRTRHRVAMLPPIVARLAGALRPRPCPGLSVPLPTRARNALLRPCTSAAASGARSRLYLEL